VVGRNQTTEQVLDLDARLAHIERHDVSHIDQISKNTADIETLKAEQAELQKRVAIVTARLNDRGD